MEINEIKITPEETAVLNKYYDKMFNIVKDRAVVGLDMSMRLEILDILEKYGLTKGHCTKCNNSLVTLFTFACRLYNANKNNTPEVKETISEDVSTASNTKKSRKTKKTE